MLNYRVVIWIIGIILIIFSGFLLIPLSWSFFHHQNETIPFLKAIITILIVGGVFTSLKPKNTKFGKREGFLIVTLSWLAMSFAGAAPYMLCGVTEGFTDAFFESASGQTTTGASIFNDIEALPEAILLWRSLTQWIGGMGIIVLTVALLPLLGVSGIELFVAEAPGPKSEKIHPRIKETAKRLWFIYLGMTVLLFLILYYVSKLSFFESLNHAMTTISTGGFSTKNASMAHYGPLVQYPIIIFMFLAGMNYTILYFGLMGRIKRVWASAELKTYVIAVFVLIMICVLGIFYSTDYSFEESFRAAAFQTISIITTTGFVSADYTSWNNGMTMFFFFLLFSGACAGSTSGGIKVIRHLVLMKNALYEFKRLLHPHAIIRIKIDQKLVQSKTITHILVFLLVYLLLFFVGSIFMSIILRDMDQPILTAIGSVATCIGNVGPAIGSVGPLDNFSQIPALGKQLLSIFMIIGRLELFTVLIIFTPFFWRSN